MLLPPCFMCNGNHAIFLWPDISECMRYGCESKQRCATYKNCIERYYKSSIGRDVSCPVPYSPTDERQKEKTLIAKDKHNQQDPYYARYVFSVLASQILPLRVCMRREFVLRQICGWSLLHKGSVLVLQLLLDVRLGYLDWLKEKRVFN